MSKMYRFAVFWNWLGPRSAFSYQPANIPLLWIKKLRSHQNIQITLPTCTGMERLTVQLINTLPESAIMSNVPLRTSLNISTCPLQSLSTVFLPSLVYFHIWCIYDLAHVNSPLWTNVFWLNMAFIRYYLFERCASSFNKRGSVSLWWQPKWDLRPAYDDCGFALQLTITQRLDILLSPTVSCAFGLGQCRPVLNFWTIPAVQSETFILHQIQ
jgi:hypothetical protein